MVKYEEKISYISSIRAKLKAPFLNYLEPSQAKIFNVKNHGAETSQKIQCKKSWSQVKSSNLKIPQAEPSCPTLGFLARA